MFINIQITSKNQKSLKNFMQLLLKLSKSKKFNFKSIFKYFPKKNQRKIITVLKSPHVNKVSQEQFEYSIKSTQLNWGNLQVLKALIFVKKIKNIFALDVNINIKFTINSQSFKLLNHFKSLKFKLHRQKDFIKILDFYGNYSFNMFK